MEAWLDSDTNRWKPKATEAARTKLNSISMIKGLRTVIYPAPDLALAKAWYEKVFGVKPYFDEPFYVGFEIGGFELGLVPDAQPSEAGPKALWGVDDIAAEVERLRAAAVTIAGEIEEVGGGIKVVDLLDPFGNRVGLIENPTFDLAKVR
jgi:predicted enzyme related to lactoylglutathione lyase